MFADLHTLHALHHIKQALTVTDDMSKTVAVSLIHTRIDYEDSVTYTSTLYKKKLECAQNSVACVVFPTLNYNGCLLRLE